MKKILSFFTVMLFAFAVNAATTVSPTAEKNNLSAAVAAATAGDVLELTNGIFNEEGNFAIDKDLTIKAAEGAKPIIKNLYYFRVESGAKVTFQGIEFDGSGASDHCLRSHNGSNGSEEVTLDNCSFHNYPSYVLYTQRNSRKWHSLTIKNCYFYDNVKYAIAIIYESSTATSCDAVSVENSTFANTTGNYAAIYIQDGNATELSVDHCTFYNFGAPFIKAEASATSIDIANSIFAQPEAKTTAPVVCSAGTVKNCLAFNTADYAEGPTVTGGIAADPKFEDAANGSFYLAEDSPARNAGTDSKTLGDQRWWEKPKLAAPDAAPAAPEWPAKQVKAVYSATYNADCGFGEWGSGTAYTQDTYGKKYVTTNLGYFGLLFEGENALNCSKMEKLHLDVWVAADASIRVVPIWQAGGAEKGVTCEVKGQQWNALEIALTEYDNVTDWSNIYQIKIDEARELTFWVNNVYFYTTVAPPVDNDAPTEFTAVAGDASYFSAQIKAKAKDASEGVIYDVINGELIVATAKAASDAEAIITVKGLKPGTEYNLSVVAKDEDGNAAEPIAVTVKTLDGPAAAAAPEFEAEKVKSLYSDAYAFAPASLNSYNEGWWSAPVMSEGELAAGDKALFYAKVTEGIIGWQYGETDMTGFPYFHIAIYPLADGTIDIGPIFGGEGKTTAAYETKGISVKANEWNYIVLDLKDKDLSSMFQLQFTNYVALNGFFVDNVYFAATAAPIKPQANIFASGLKGALSADGSQFDIEYFLNADATEIEVEFFNAEGEMELKTPLTIAEQLTAGAHKVSIEMSPSETFDPGTYSWTIHAYAGPTEFKDMLPADDNRYNYYMPMSIVVDNSFESDFFGRVYVSESVDGADDGASDATKQQVRGIYIYNPDMNFANGQEMAVLGYDGGLLGDRTSSAGFRRLAIDAKGNVYVASLDDATKGVYRMDPANPAADFVTVLQTERPVDALEIVGDTLYTIENVAESSGEFDIYDMTTIPVGKPVKRMLTTAADSDKGLANSFITLRSDGRGGFWVAQHRWGPTPYPPFEHWNSNREVDFKIDGENSEILGDITGNVSYRGQIAVNVAGDKIAIGSNKCAKVFSVTYGDDGVPVLTFICMTPQFGNNIDGLAFDVADNLYVASASVERFYQFPLAKEEGANHTRVYAPSKYNLVIKEEDAVDNINATVAPTKVIRNGQVLIIRDGVEYNVLGAEMR